jgi:hypothetical protein
MGIPKNKDKLPLDLSSLDLLTNFLILNKAQYLDIQVSISSQTLTNGEIWLPQHQHKINHSRH